MDKDSCGIDFPPDLHARAEAAVQTEDPDLARLSPDQLRDLIHELRVKSAERDLQGEELRNACEEYSHRAEDARRLLECSSDIIARFDRDLHIRYANPAFERITGVSGEQAVGRSLTEIQFPFVNVHIWESCIRQAFGENQEVTIEFEYSGTWGRRFYRAHAIPEQNEGETPEQVLVIAHDISDLVETREKLRESEGQLNAFFGSSPARMTILDEDLRFVRVNKTSEQIFGIEQDKIVGKCFRDFVPNFALVIEEHARKVLETGEPLLDRDVSGEFPGRPGQVIAWSTSYFPLPLPDGRRGVGVLAVDITERKQAEEALLRSEQRYRKLFENNLAGNYLVTFDGKIIDLNDAMMKMLGYDSREEVLRRNAADFYVDPEVRKEMIRLLERDGIAPAKEVLLKRKDGSVVNAFGYAVVLTDDHTGEPYLQGVAIDITRRTRAEERLAGTLRDLAFLSESATRFLEAMPSGELFRYTAEQLHSIGGNAIIAVSEYAPVSNQTIVRAVDGPEGKLRRLGELFGRDPTELAFTVAEGTRERLTRGRLERVASLHDLTFNQLPPSLATQIERELELGDIYVMPFFLGEDLMGTVSVGTDRSEGLINRELMEAVVNQAALALKRTRTEEALRESEQRFRGAVESFPGMFKVYDPDRRIRYINRQGAALTGNTPEEITGKRDEEYLPPEIADTFVPVLLRALETKQPQSMENFLVMPDGVKWFLANFIPLLTERRQIWQILGTAVDITGRKKAEENAIRLNEHLRRQTARLEAINKELEAFSYSISHDLRAPLRTLDGFSLALLEDYSDRLDAEGKDYLNRIRVAATRMARLIDDLLQLSRTSRAKLKYTMVNLSAQAKSVLDELHNAEPERKVETVIQEGMIVEGDETLLRQVMQNLLGNAWKFTLHTENARIEFGETRENGKRAFFIRDNGAGFDMRYADKLYIPFQRLHSDNEFTGTGIGLSIVKRIIDRHGGTIRAESEPGKGATFFFTLGE